MSRPNIRMLMGGYSGGEGYQIFTSSGVWDWGLAGSPDFVDVLVVGGGGSSGRGGTSYSAPYLYVAPGGGSAGEVVVRTQLPVSGDVEVTIGSGGFPSVNTHQGVSGGDSFFGDVRARGGGYGGGRRIRYMEGVYIRDDYEVTNGVNGGGGASSTQEAGSGSVGRGEFPGQDGVVGGNPGIGGGYGSIVSRGRAGVSTASFGFDVPGSYRVGGSNAEGSSSLNRGFGGRAGAYGSSSTITRGGSSGLVIVKWGDY